MTYKTRKTFENTKKNFKLFLVLSSFGEDWNCNKHKQAILAFFLFSLFCSHCRDVKDLCRHFSTQQKAIQVGNELNICRVLVMELNYHFLFIDIPHVEVVVEFRNQFRLNLCNEQPYNFIESLKIFYQESKCLHRMRNWFLAKCFIDFLTLIHAVVAEHILTLRWLSGHARFWPHW